MSARPASMQAIALACTVLLASACAPDSVRNSSPFDDWVAGVARACNYQMIGKYEVGSLLGMNATDQATVFLDQTSRLYFGRISPAQWSNDASSALNGTPADPGVACVLAQLPKR